MAIQKISVSLPQDVLREVALRNDERSTQIAYMLTRYAEIMRRERRTLREMFNDQELGLILDANNGVAYLDPFSIQLVDAGVADAIEMDQLDRKWNVDGPVLILKLSNLSYAQKCALVDACQYWWAQVGGGMHPPYADALVWPRGGLEAE